MIAVLEEAIRRNDIKGIERIKKVFDRECLNDSLFQIDQTLNGIVATKLYCHTNDYKYLAYSNRMYNWLKSLFIPEIGILYRSKETFQIVDGLGMYIPFLVNYAEIKDSTESLLIVKQSVEWYIKYGIDKDTGIPAHGVQIFSPFLKKGSINWGRGCSWWALALCCINDEMLDVENREIVLKFKDTILNLYHSQGYFSQFLSDKGQIDLTSTIPLLFYLTDMKVLSATDDFKLSFSKYLHNGVLYYSSGPTEGLNRYSPFSGENLLAQAIMLKWLNIN